MSAFERNASMAFLRASKKALGVLGNDLSLAELRRLHEELTEPVWRDHCEAGPDVERVWDVAIPVEGAPDLRARLYRPTVADDGSKPSMHVHVHGGGWWQGSIDQWIVDVQCRERSAFGNSIVVSIDYRKAPEWKFPCAIDDVTAALVWSVENAAGLGASDRLTVSGVSAGANLVAAAVLHARDNAGPVVHHQILEATPVDLRVDAPTAWAAADGGDPKEFAAIVGYYVDHADDVADPLVSPLLAPDLAGLPPTTLLIGNCDPFHTGTLAFAERLRRAGVAVRLREFNDFLHHTPALTAVIPAARAWRDEVATIIREQSCA